MLATEGAETTAVGMPKVAWVCVAARLGTLQEKRAATGSPRSRRMLTVPPPGCESTRFTVPLASAPPGCAVAARVNGFAAVKQASGLVTQPFAQAVESVQLLVRLLVLQR